VIGSTRAAALLLALSAAPRLLAQPAGAEFRVNATTTGYQYGQAVAVGNDEFVIVWEGNQSGAFDIYQQRFDGSGSLHGGELRVNTYTTGAQRHPAVAMDLARDFVVVWEGFNQVGPRSVFGQRYQNGGTPLGGEFRVNTSTTNSSYGPRVAMDPAGNFVVVWTNADGSSSGIFGQRFSATGERLGAEFVVNSVTANVQDAPDVKMDAGGGFAVTWESLTAAGTDIFFRRFSTTGAPLGADLRANTTITGTQFGAAIGVDASGNFLVAWSDASGVDPQIRAQLYSFQGTPIGGELHVNQETGQQQSPRISGFPGGGFLVAWSSQLSNIAARVVQPDGSFSGDELRVNTSAGYTALRPEVSAEKDGYVVTWDSFAEDGNKRGVYARRFTRGRRSGDVDGNRIVDIADVFYLINFLFASGPPPK
jgi:hypothetical protein